ncbi:hypothetical protein G7Y89_g9846 [Cudoniella acicularis]|uniref:Uncharacterized protein n=1 Tax=Cudoniella acicularis TaxID=354080 RepID=A0A8H4RDW4_9HELO|nr:hypothetical protein G7Y89_g9846 [Cudoniella acicularis]
MMMNSGNWERNTMGYATVETLLDDVSKQMALSNLSRYSRGNTQRATGSMRVVKPNSASNSPRGSIGLGRRRTVMSDSPYRRRVPMVDQSVVPSSSAGFISNDGLQIPTRSNRPMSWHPASQNAPQPTYQPSYQAPTYDMNNQYQPANLPPTPVVYSGYTSPASTFSPLSIPYTGYEPEQYHFQDTSVHCQPNDGYFVNQQVMVQQQQTIYTPPTTTNMDSTMYSHFDWSNFATNGFESSTTPPTPDNFLPIQHPEASFPAEESIPYHPLSDTESVEDDLVGVGLYDTPEDAKSPSSDPHLDNYRSLLMSQFLGATYRRPESTGKGLKLEETWNPPASDDEDDDEQDGEGEDEEESIDGSESNNGQCTTVINVKHEATDTGAMNGEQYHRNGWL